MWDFCSCTFLHRVEGFRDSDVGIFIREKQAIFFAAVCQHNDGKSQKDDCDDDGLLQQPVIISCCWRSHVLLFFNC